MESKTKKNILFIAVKVLISALLLAIIFRKAGLRDIYSHLQAMDLRYFFFASVLYIPIVFIAAFRWSLLLEGAYPLGRLFSLYFIGSFFNHILPGNVGGDTVKIYYLYKDTKKGGSSFGSVFLDRYIGLFALLTLGFVSGLFAFHELKNIGIQWLVPSLFAAYILGGLFVFGFRIGRRFSVVSDFYDYFHKYLRKKATLLKVFSLSLILQTLSIGMIYIIASGLGLKLTFTALFVFVPIIVTITAVPVSISGFGVREGAFVLLFGLVGVPPQESASISVLWFLSMAMTSLIGLVEYIRYRYRKNRIEP